MCSECNIEVLGDSIFAGEESLTRHTKELQANVSFFSLSRSSLCLFLLSFYIFFFLLVFPFVFPFFQLNSCSQISFFRIALSFLGFSFHSSFGFFFSFSCCPFYSFPFSFTVLRFRQVLNGERINSKGYALILNFEQEIIKISGKGTTRA